MSKIWTIKKPLGLLLGALFLLSSCSKPADDWSTMSYGTSTCNSTMGMGHVGFKCAPQ